MSGDFTDMSTPVTRGELRDELAQLENRIEHKLGHLERRFDDKLDLWGGALLARIQSSEQRLLAELARHTQASHEATLAHISACLEPFAGLPERMSRLEAGMFPSKLR